MVLVLRLTRCKSSSFILISADFLKLSCDETEATITLGIENDPIAVMAVWSPSGLSRIDGCVLGVLDSHHRVSLWESNTIGITQDWKAVPPFMAIVFNRFLISLTTYSSMSY